MTGPAGRRRRYGFPEDTRVADARVAEVVDVTPVMREIRLRGPGFRMMSSKPGAHLPVHVPVPGAAAAVRTYSVWSHSRAEASLALRIAVHEPGGPGSRWAERVRPDDRIRLGTPRNRIALDRDAGYHLFVGEETAAVPLLTMLAALDPAAGAHGVLESSGPETEVAGHPGARTLPWVHRGSAPADGSAALLRALGRLDLPDVPGVAYVAGGSATCRAVARHLIRDRGWPRSSVRSQSHWTTGQAGLV